MNINKIKLSGTTYSIQDENATKTVELTQAQYDALSVKDPNTFYIITDATAGDLSNYYTKSETSGATEISTALASKADTATTYTKTETDNAITAATSTKQDTLVSGTNIKTINNQSLLGDGNIVIQGGGGGGKAIEAGRGISITTGETADTVSFNLPLSSSTIASDSIVGGYYGNKSMAQYGFAYGDNAECGNNGAAAIALGRNVTANGAAAIALGSDCTAKLQSVSIGRFINTNILGEIGVGIYNVSSSASTTFGDSGNTLFSVGNGTADNARHNAFEIRQNGDIYLTKDGQDVKLQDQLGGGGGSDINVVQTTGTSTADVMSQDAVTTAINDLEETLAAKINIKQGILTEGNGITIEEDVISVTGKVDTSTYNTYTAATDTALASKQTTLTAGTGISIVDNVISATGGGGSITIDPSLDSGSTNPVANSAITNAIANATNGTLKEDLVFSTTCGYGTIESNYGSIDGEYLRINIYPAKIVQFGQYRSWSGKYYYKCFVLDIETKTEYNAYWNVTYNGITSSGGTGINYVTLNLPDGRLKFTVTDDTKYRIIGFERDNHGSSRESYSMDSTYEVNIPSGTTTNELFQYIENVDRTKNVIGLTAYSLGGLKYQNFTDEIGGRIYYRQTIFPPNTSFTAHTANTTIHVTSTQTTAWDAKVDSSAITTSISSSSTDAQVPSAKAVYDALQEGGSGGGGMTEDDELLLSTALTDLNDRKIDASEVKANYQMKGDYATKDYVATALEPYETKLDEINTEEVTAYALNDLNTRFGGLKLTKITESEYAALTTKDENTLYIVVADPS